MKDEGGRMKDEGRRKRFFLLPSIFFLAKRQYVKSSRSRFFGVRRNL
jgi:hypothetical protein